MEVLVTPFARTVAGLELVLTFRVTSAATCLQAPSSKNAPNRFRVKGLGVQDLGVKGLGVQDLGVKGLGVQDLGV